MSKRLKVFVRREALEREMARRNFSQNGLARGLKVTSGYLSQMVRGQRCPSPELRERLQTLLRIDDFDVLFQVGADGCADV